MIGVFDSGIGGLTVWKEVVKLLPNKSIIYLADQANCPYGHKSGAEIEQLVQKAIDFLLAKQCTLIVLACNTATAFAIQKMRMLYPHVPFVGMEPAIKPAAKLTQTGVVGILATEMTLNGKHFHKTKETYASHIKVLVQVGKGLVELAEQAQHQSEAAYVLLEEYLQPMMAKGMDQLVLGCTHYPFFTPTIAQITQGKVNIIDPAPAVAKQVQKQWQMHSLDSIIEEKANYEFYSTQLDKRFENLVDSIITQLGIISYKIGGTLS